MKTTKQAMIGWRWVTASLVLASLLVFMPALVVLSAGQAESPIVPEGGTAPASWLARGAGGADTGDLSRALGQYGVSDARYYPELDVWEFSIPPASMAEARRDLTADDRFEWITPNPQVVAAETPDDPYYGSRQWSLPIIEAPAAWDITTGSSDVIIAILDTGISLDHPDLESKIWINEDEIAGNGVDDDANGFIDDRWGWNFDTESAITNDDQGHGTHVAGIAGAATNNSVGVAGVSWSSPLMAVKFLDSHGDGNFLDMLQGVTYAVDNGASVLNLSLTIIGDLTAEQETLLDERVDYATSHEVLVVAASGNQGRSRVSYPAAHPDVVAVGATTSSDSLWSSSNYGEGLDLVAPGANVYSTYRDWAGTPYERLSGTSMATPHVAGAAALLWSVAPDYSPAQIRQILRATADDINGANYPGTDQWMGWGRLNLWRAMQAATTGQVLQVSPRSPVFRVLEDALTITATLSTDLGAPFPDGTVVTFTTDAGSLSANSVETVAGVATTQFDGGTTPGDAVVTISTGAVTETLDIDIRAGAPAHIEINTEPETIVAGDEPATVTIAATDGAFNPVSDGTALEFEVTDGVIYPTHVVTFGGEAHTSFTPPETIGPVTLSVEVESTFIVTRTLDVWPAAADQMVLETAEDWLWAGEISMPISVTVSDRFGNPVVDGQNVTLETTMGDMTPAIGVTQAGIVTGTLTGNLSRGQVCISAYLDELSASHCLGVFAPTAWMPRLATPDENP